MPGKCIYRKLPWRLVVEFIEMIGDEVLSKLGYDYSELLSLVGSYDCSNWNENELWIYYLSKKITEIFMKAW